jgi:hypothetical protein
MKEKNKFKWIKIICGIIVAGIILFYLWLFFTA